MDAGKAVLVTGASTGIGRKITERLATEGYFVYAGARRDSDLRALGIINNVQALRLDVTKSQDISASLERVKKAGCGLFGLVNNAGVATMGALVNGDDNEFDLAMAVNVRGPYCVTRAFAPLIVAEKGRIVTIGSIAGILAEENVSVYSMSKHAVEAFTDSLAMEMEPLGVHVSIVEPGPFNTELAKNAIVRMGANPRFPDLSKEEDPDDVAATVALALSEPLPKRRYLVVTSENDARRTIKKQIAQLVQLNEGHDYTYSRDCLIEMLDDALAQSRPRASPCPAIVSHASL